MKFIFLSKQQSTQQFSCRDCFTCNNSCSGAEQFLISCTKMAIGVCLCGYIYIYNHRYIRVCMCIMITLYVL